MVFKTNIETLNIENIHVILVVFHIQVRPHFTAVFHGMANANT